MILGLDQFVGDVYSVQGMNLMRRSNTVKSIETNGCLGVFPIALEDGVRSATEVPDDLAFPIPPVQLFRFPDHQPDLSLPSAREGFLYLFDPGDDDNTAFAVAGHLDFDGVPDGVRCKPGSCQTEWVEPSYRIHVPTYDPAACAADPDNVLVCTPFYGGRLMAHYIGGLNDTYGWEVRLPGLPYLVR